MASPHPTARRLATALLAALGVLAAPPVPAVASDPTHTDEGWRLARRGHPWSFPADHWSHPGYRTEWWYLTGLLASDEDPSRRFGYQFTVFRVGLRPEPPASRSAWAATDLVMGHAAITDVARGEHRFAEVLYRAVPFLGGFPAAPEPTLAWSRGPPGTRARWEIAWRGEGFELRAADEAGGIAFELEARPRRLPVLQGPGGLSQKGEGVGAASLYYSFPRLVTRGTLQVAGETHRVSGTSWMDKEFSSDSLGSEQVGWDWFGLRLADGRDLMLYLLRARGGAVDHARGTLVGRDGEPAYLEREDFTVEVLATWTSPHSGTTYPARWRLRVPAHGVELEVVPSVADQENRSRRIPRLDYWEGAVELRGPGGAVAGEGYVELTGHGQSRRPGL